MRKRMLWAGLLLVIVQAATAADDQDHGAPPAPSADVPQAPARPAATDAPQDGRKANESDKKGSGEESSGSDPDCN